MNGNIEQVFDEYARFIGWVFVDAMKREIQKHGITSYVEQMFYAGWRAMEFGTKNGPSELIPQYEIGKYRVDFYVPKTNVVIEIDSFAFHERSSEQLTYERRRHREIEDLGYIFIRFSAKEV